MKWLILGIVLMIEFIYNIPVQSRQKKNVIVSSDEKKTAKVLQTHPLETTKENVNLKMRKIAQEKKHDLTSSRQDRALLEELTKETAIKRAVESLVARALSIDDFSLQKGPWQEAVDTYGSPVFKLDISQDEVLLKYPPGPDNIEIEVSSYENGETFARHTYANGEIKQVTQLEDHQLQAVGFYPDGSLMFLTRSVGTEVYTLEFDTTGDLTQKTMGQHDGNGNLYASRVLGP